ncbi:MAG: HAD family hydrolase [Holophagaceae bacterium]|uniref:HAD family hydrolase n=1 Tax=Candidatus Geothrix skivensis TaxID=2954439 RepID=A0A9D7XJQ5_9BACT|nr:HAD family hydrolase [Candidatus Geothrix skivensis]
MIRAVVFDLWNTLVFSPAGSPFQRMKDLLRPEQVAFFPALVRDGMVQPHASVRAFLETWKGPVHLDEAQMEAMVQAFAEAGGQAECFPGTPEAVGAVRDLARVALLSNTQTFGLELLERLGIAERIRTRILSAEIGALKPEPSAFETVQRRLGLFPGNLAMVGDNWNDDVEGAVAAGWTAIWVNRELKPRPDHDPELPIYEVRSLDRVPELIRSLQEGMRCPTCLG